jgi:hypothetical protein
LGDMQFFTTGPSSHLQSLLLSLLSEIGPVTQLCWDGEKLI